MQLLWGGWTGVGGWADDRHEPGHRPIQRLQRLSLMGWILTLSPSSLMKRIPRKRTSLTRRRTRTHILTCLTITTCCPRCPRHVIFGGGGPGWHSWQHCRASSTPPQLCMRMFLDMCVHVQPCSCAHGAWAHTVFCTWHVHAHALCRIRNTCVSMAICDRR